MKLRLYRNIRYKPLQIPCFILSFFLLWSLFWLPWHLGVSSLLLSKALVYIYIYKQQENLQVQKQWCCYGGDKGQNHVRKKT